MIKKHFKSISATAFQIVFNQVLGLVFYILLAVYLAKGAFGDLNWAMAVSYTLTMMLTFGLDHVSVRRIAAGSDARNIAGTYFTHTVLFSIAIFLLLAGHRYVFPGFHSAHQLLFVVLTGSLFTFISFPFRQMANGLQKFWHLALMNISGNAVKVVGGLLLIVLNKVSAANMGWLFLISGVCELVVAIVLVQNILGTRLKMVFNKKTYTLLFRESLPQLGFILLESSLARIDLILMGLLSTNIFTADYSFSYKAFDSSRIPLLILAPVLLPKMAKIYSKDATLTEDNITELNKLWKTEAVIAVLIPLVLNVCWVDVVNLVTRNNYAESTRPVYGILSIALPMLYVINFFWTIAFAQKRIKDTVKISAIVTATNLVLNLILIRYYNAIGAAIAFTCSLFLQMVLYRVMVKEPSLKTNIFDFLKTMVIAAAIIFGVQYLELFWMLKVIIAVAAYAVVIYMSGILKDVIPEKYTFKTILGRRN